MGEVFYFIILFLVSGLLAFGLYWLGKLFFYLLPKKLKQSKAFNIFLNILSILMVILSILITVISVIHLFKSCSEKKTEKEWLDHEKQINSYKKDTLYLIEKSKENIILHKIEQNNSYNRLTRPPEDRLSNREKEKLRILHEYELEKLDKLHKYELEKSVKLDKLIKGKIAYEVPDTMDIEKNYKATVIITKAINDSILLQELYQENFQTEEIKISSRVKVFLIDPTEKNFNITSLNTIEQLVEDSTNTIWKWNIIPKRGGDNELILRVTIKVLDRLGETYQDIKVFEKTIKVNTPILARIKQFIDKYWQWLATFIIIPLVIWGYKTLSIRKRKNADRKKQEQEAKNRKKANRKRKNANQKQKIENKKSTKYYIVKQQVMTKRFGIKKR